MISDSKAHLEKDSPEGTSLATATMGDNLAMDEAAPADARYRRIQLWVHRISVLQRAGFAGHLDRILGSHPLSRRTAARVVGRGEHRVHRCLRLRFAENTILN